jgi:DNA replication protein DnaC
MTTWQNKHLRLTVTHPKIKEMADAAQDLAKWYARDERLFRRTNLVICGDSGSGKTHVSKALYTWARTYSGRLGASTDWHSWPEACKVITEGYSGCIQDMMEADFLCIDDIGAETATKPEH